MHLTLVGKDPDSNLDLCRASFEAVWALSIPHREYQPV